MTQKTLLILATTLAFSTPAFAKQSLQAAMLQNPKLAALVEAVKDSAGVDCLTVDSVQSSKITGPDGKNAITQTAACFDPDAFNPSQLGQLIVTYYGSGESADATVESVIGIEFEVFK